VTDADRARSYRQRQRRGKMQFTIELTTGERNALVRGG
jgi:hypothetical protein